MQYTRARGKACIMKTSGYSCNDCKALLTPSQRQNKAVSVAFRSLPNVWETFVWRIIKVSVTEKHLKSVTRPCVAFIKHAESVRRPFVENISAISRDLYDYLL